MSVNQIIELKENLENRIDNGYYKVNLPNYDLKLEPNDTLSIHSAFLDSVSVTTSQIEVNEDTDCTMTYYLYNRMNRADGLYNRDDNSQIAGALPDGSLSVLTQEHDKGITMQKIFGFNLPVADPKEGWCGPGFQYDFQYEDSTGKIIKVNFASKDVGIIDLPPKGNGAINSRGAVGFGWGIQDPVTKNSTPVAGVNNKRYVFWTGGGFPIVCKKDTFKLTRFAGADGTLARANFDFPFQNVDNSATVFFKSFEFPLDPAPGAETIYEPIPFSHKFTVPTGKYTASELAAFISLQCQKAQNQIEITTDLVESDFLIESKDQTAEDKSLITVRRDDSVEVLYYKTNQWIGASTITLSFDEQDNKFYWEFAHTPYFSGSGGISIGFNESVDQTKKFYGSNNGGIIFQNLEPQSFWFNQLGFDQSLLQQPTYISHTLPASAVDVQVPKFDLTAGTHIVTAQIINDVAIKKNATFYKVPTITYNTDTVDSNLTTLIPAKNAIFETSADTGYYYIDINANFKNDFYTEAQNFASIAGIVSNYYNQNSYTSASSDAGIQYVHQGPSINLNSFTIRILDQNKQLASKLGLNNTIFLSLQKAPENLPYYKEQEMKQLENKKK